MFSGIVETVLEEDVISPNTAFSVTDIGVGFVMFLGVLATVGYIVAAEGGLEWLTIGANGAFVSVVKGLFCVLLKEGVLLLGLGNTRILVAEGGAACRTTGANEDAVSSEVVAAPGSCACILISLVALEPVPSAILMYLGKSICFYIFGGNSLTAML